jgi:hypothetical protein
MITVVVILNCNQSLIKNYIRKFRDMEIQEKHTTQTERNLESLSALVLILKKESFLYYIQQEETFDRSWIYVFIQTFTTQNGWTSYK